MRSPSLHFSQELFGITTLGATVVVEGDAANHITTTDASLLAPMNVKGQQVTQQHLGSAEFRWEPDKSPTGPLTIIVSKHDQRIVVLRNGVETRISCTWHQATATCAAFIEESRMKFINANELHRKSGG
jgi:hypothetical protein